MDESADVRRGQVRQIEGRRTVAGTVSRSDQRKKTGVEGARNRAAVAGQESARQRYTGWELNNAAQRDHHFIRDRTAVDIITHVNGGNVADKQRVGRIVVDPRGNARCIVVMKINGAAGIGRRIRMKNQR